MDSKNSKGNIFVTSRLCAWGWDSCGKTRGWTSNGASIKPPILSERYCLEKLSKLSIKSIIESASPSASLLFAECQFGVAKQTWVSVYPIILPTIPTEVWGANPIIKWPSNSSVFLTL